MYYVLKSFGSMFGEHVKRVQHGTFTVTGFAVESNEEGARVGEVTGYGNGGMGCGIVEDW